ncbi:MAG TPA: helix-turn-helix domain-containing protein, partial [bacterium]
LETRKLMGSSNTNQVDRANLSPEESPGLPFVSNREVPRLLRDVEMDCILDALEKTNGNRRKAADLIGIGVATLYRKLKAYKLDKERF